MPIQDLKVLVKYILVIFSLFYNPNLATFFLEWLYSSCVIFKIGASTSSRNTGPSAHPDAEQAEDEECFHDSERPDSILSGLATLYKNDAFIDVRLKVGNKEFACHRNILAMSSPYFMAMFSSELMEKGNDLVSLFMVLTRY